MASILDLPELDEAAIRLRREELEREEAEEARHTSETPQKQSGTAALTSVGTVSVEVNKPRNLEESESSVELSAAAERIKDVNDSYEDETFENEQINAKSVTAKATVKQSDPTLPTHIASPLSQSQSQSQQRSSLLSGPRPPASGAPHPSVSFARFHQHHGSAGGNSNSDEKSTRIFRSALVESEDAYADDYEIDGSDSDKDNEHERRRPSVTAPEQEPHPPRQSFKNQKAIPRSQFTQTELSLSSKEDAESNLQHRTYNLQRQRKSAQRAAASYAESFATESSASSASDGRLTVRDSALDSIADFLRRHVQVDRRSNDDEHSLSARPWTEEKEALSRLMTLSEQDNPQLTRRKANALNDISDYQLLNVVLAKALQESAVDARSTAELRRRLQTSKLDNAASQLSLHRNKLQNKRRQDAGFRDAQPLPAALVVELIESGYDGLVQSMGRWLSTNDLLRAVLDAADKPLHRLTRAAVEEELKSTIVDILNDGEVKNIIKSATLRKMKQRLTYEPL